MPTIADDTFVPLDIEVIDVEVNDSDYHSELPAGTFVLDIVLRVRGRGGSRGRD